MVSPSNTVTPSASRKFFLFVSALVCFALLFSYEDFAQSEELLSLNQQALVLQLKGDYKGAAELGRKALDIAEREFGPGHPNVAVNLNNLGLLYHAQGRYAEAEPLFKLALAIREKALGPNHPAVPTSLQN